VNFFFILDINPLVDMWFANIFSHSLGCTFALLLVSFVGAEAFWFDVVLLVKFLPGLWSTCCLAP